MNEMKQKLKVSRTYRIISKELITYFKSLKVEMNEKNGTRALQTFES